MKKNKKGFSLVECIIAIVIITTISIVSVSTYISAQSTTNKEWDKFKASMVADSSVSAFQSADKIADFMKRSPEGLKALKTTQEIYNDSGEEISEEPTQPETPEEIPTSVDFKSIRAYENGKVKLFNRALDVNTDTYTDEIASFNYSGKEAQYKADKQYLDGLSFYNKAKKEDSSDVVTTAFKFTQAKGTSHMSMGGERTDPNKATFDYNDGKVSITDNSGKTKSYDQTPLEAYLVSKGQFLGFADNTNVGNTMNGTPIMYEPTYDASGNKKEDGVFYFYVYQLDYSKSPITVSKVKSGRNTKVIRVTYDDNKDLFSSADKSSWNTEKCIHVKSVQWAWVPVDDYTGNNTVQAKYNDYFTDDNGNKFENFDWYGLPLFAYYCNGNQNEGRTPNWTLKGGISNHTTVKKLIYTDYSLKTGAGVTALKIDYALYKNTDTKLYTKEKDTLLYKYTGGDAKNILTDKFGFSQNYIKVNGEKKAEVVDGYNKYLVYIEEPDPEPETEPETEIIPKNAVYIQTGYYYYLPENSSSGCFMKVTYSNSWYDERKIQAWVMNKSDIEKLKTDIGGVSGSDDSEIADKISAIDSLNKTLMKNPDFSYRKG